jgi:tetratricopeptide (TPR) repeat protein
MATVTPSQTNMLCVICHQPINLTHFGMGRVILEQNYVGCPNGHLLHRECLKHWIVKNRDCPVCHEPYDVRVISVYNDYLNQLDADRKVAEERKRQLESQAAVAQDQPAADPDYEAKMQQAEQYALKEDFTAAMNIYWDILDQKKYPEKDARHLRLLLHLALVYYRMGKFAMSVKQLMNLVKIDFEYPLAFYYLGMSYEEVDLPDKAKWAYERALINAQKLVEKDKQFEPYVVDIGQRLKKF